MERDRGGSLLRGSTDPPGDSHHGSYGFAKTKKKEKGYKSVGLVSSEDDDDASMMINSGPSSQSSAGKSKSKPAFRLKKKKSFKDLKSGEDKGVDELVERTKVKYKANTNPFHDRPVADGKRQSALGRAQSKDESETQIFGIPLTKAVQIDRCPDGLEIPAFFRVCVNYIEDNGMDSVGIYRTSGSQTRIQELKRHFNRGDRVRLNDYDVPTVADVMKLYIRELPQKLIPEELVLELEEAIELPDVGKRADAAIRVLAKLEACHRTLLGWIFIHMSHIIERQEENKMNVRNVALVLEPTLRIQSNKVLNFFLTHPTDVFPDIKITKQGIVSSQNTGTKDALAQLKEDLTKKEVLLNHLHHEIKQGKASKRKEEQLWDIQRQVTELKRKIRTLEKMTTVMLPSEGAKNSVEPRSATASSTSDQILKPQPVVRIHSRQIEENLLKKLEETTEEAVSDEQRQEMVRQLLHQVHLHDALQSHNKHLRERIVKETDSLARSCQEMHLLPQIQAVFSEDEIVDRSALVKELRDLMETYQKNKAMTTELNDAICSETSGWIGVVGELNSRKARNCSLGSAV